MLFRSGKATPFVLQRMAFGSIKKLNADPDVPTQVIIVRWEQLKKTVFIRQGYVSLQIICKKAQVLIGLLVYLKEDDVSGLLANFSKKEFPI